MRWVGIHEIGMIPSGDVIHELRFDPRIIGDVVDPHVRPHVEDTPASVDSNAIRLATSWVRKDLGRVTTPFSGAFSIGVLRVPFRGFQVDDEDIIEDLSLEANSTDTSEDHDSVADLSRTVVGSGCRGSDFRLGILGDTARFLVVGLLPLPLVSELEEVTVVEAFVG